MAPSSAGNTVAWDRDTTSTNKKSGKIVTAGYSPSVTSHMRYRDPPSPIQKSQDGGLPTVLVLDYHQASNSIDSNPVFFFKPLYLYLKTIPAL